METFIKLRGASLHSPREGIPHRIKELVDIADVQNIEEQLSFKRTNSLQRDLVPATQPQSFPGHAARPPAPSAATGPHEVPPSPQVLPAGGRAGARPELSAQPLSKQRQELACSLASGCEVLTFAF